MAYPAGVITRPVTFGPAFELEDGDVAGMQVTFKATRPGVLWLETGQPAVSTQIVKNADDGVEQTVYLPVTDQDGWGDGDGNLIVPGADGHVFLYIVTVIFTQNGRTIPGAQPRSKVVPIPQGDLTPLDLDKLIPLTTPGGTVVSVPDIWSEQIAAAEAAAVAAAESMIDSDTFMASKTNDPTSEFAASLSATIETGIEDQVPTLIEDLAAVTVAEPTSGAGYPARPAGAAVVLFVGWTNPDGLMQAHDAWVDLNAAPVPTQQQITDWTLNAAELLGAAVLKVAHRAADRVLLGRGSNAFNAISGSPDTNWIGGGSTTREFIWRLDANADETIGSTIMCPREWNEARVRLVWANTATSTGDARFGISCLQYNAGENATTATTELGDQTLPAPTTAGPTSTYTWPALVTLTGKELLRVVLTRRAVNAADTLANDAGIVGIILERAS